MIDKTLCSDFAMCIFDRFVDGDTFEKYAKIVRNLIDALMFDSTISSSDAVAFVQEMVKQAGSRGFNFSNETILFQTVCLRYNKKKSTDFLDL